SYQRKILWDSKPVLSIGRREIDAIIRAVRMYLSYDYFFSFARHQVNFMDKRWRYCDVYGCLNNVPTKKNNVGDVANTVVSARPQPKRDTFIASRAVNRHFCIAFIENFARDIPIFDFWKII